MLSAGKTLRETIREKSKDIDHKRVVRLLKDLTGAIDHLQKNGIVHRDIKPENIMYNL